MTEIKIEVDIEKKEIGRVIAPKELNPIELASILNNLVGNLLNKLKPVEQSKIIKPKINIVGAGGNNGNRS